MISYRETKIEDGHENIDKTNDLDIFNYGKVHTKNNGNRKQHLNHYFLGQINMKMN